MKLKAATLLSTLALSGACFAQAAPPAPDYTLSYNVGVVSDYRYRGISQTRLKPALQGGVDFAHSSGFYLGTWASTIRWIEDNRAVAPATPIDGSVEIDLYGGYKGTAGDLGYDVGLLHYWYPGNDLQRTGGGGVYDSANTTEVYGAVSFGPATLKYSHSVSNLFGYLNSKGSGYLDLSATFDLGGGWSLVPHIGHQKVKNLRVASYTDYSLTVAKDLGSGFIVSAAAVGTDADTGNYANPVNAKFMGKSGFVVGAKYSF